MTLYRLIIVVFLVSCETQKQQKGPVLARVNNKTLTLNNLATEKTINKKFVPGLISDWIDNTILLNKAKERGFDKDSTLIKKRDAFFKNLVITSFLQQNLDNNIAISKENILAYYKENKTNFIRSADEILIEHYLTKNMSLSKTVKETLLTNENKKNKTLVTNYLIESKIVKKDRVSPLFKQIFDTKKSVVGPIKTKKGYHLFKIIKRYEKGSFLGLDAVYDEIYQRLYKKEERKKSLLYLDSIKNQFEIYINPKYQ